MPSPVQLSPRARRRALKLKLGRIRRKIERREADLATYPPETPGAHSPRRAPSLFDTPKFDERRGGVSALRQELVHLRSRESQLVAKLRQVK